MTWGPMLTPEEYSAIVQRQIALIAEIAALDDSLSRLNDLENEQQLQLDADKAMYDYFNTIAWNYEAEYRSYIGYYFAGELVLDSDLEAAAKNEDDTKLFPNDWTDPYAPKTSIEALNIIPYNANTYDFKSEVALSGVLIYVMRGLRTDKVDDSEPGSAETTSSINESSTSVSVDDASPFSVNDWAVITKIGESIIDSGTDGQCQDSGGGDNNKFVSNNASFIADGVKPFDKLVITGGANDGEYIISSIESETVLYIANEFVSVPTTNETYSITRTIGNKMAVVEITGKTVGPPASLDITVLVILGCTIGSGAFISSQLSDFRSIATSMMGQLNEALEIQKDSLENNNDNISSSSASGEIANALSDVSDTYDAYTNWLQSAGVELESGIDGQCVDPGGGADNRFTSASAFFQANGVQPGDTLIITTGGSNDGVYSILYTESETSLRTALPFPSVPSSNEVYEVRHGSQWEDGVLEVIEIMLSDRVGKSASRKEEIERAVSISKGIYERRAVWINALVNRAFGTWTTLENTKASISLLELQQGDLDEVNDTYEEFLNQ